MRVLFSCGGTAGHITPAIAIAEALIKKHPDWEVIFVGTPTGMERKIVSALGYPFYSIPSMGLQRRLTLKNLRAAATAITSIHKAKRLLTALAPSAVVGTGGYACWPTLRAANTLGIPTLLHESNAMPGLAVRRLEGRVSRLLLNFEESKQYLRAPHNSLVIGNPLRVDFSAHTKEEARRALGIAKGSFLLVSFGGSRGATALNTVMPDFMRLFSLKEGSVMHLHGVGADGGACLADFNKVKCSGGGRIRVETYLSDMPLWLRAADLAITRAGAMTLSELAFAACPAILIPSPFVADDHQTKNALLYKERGAAILLPEKELTASHLARTVKAIFSSRSKREEMQRQMRALSVDKAAEKAVREIEFFCLTDS